MSENLFKENIEKSKEVLKEHFERRKQERRRDLDVPRYTTLNIHSGENWTIDEEEFDDFTKSRDSLYEKLIWDTPIEKKEKKNEKQMLAYICKECGHGIAITSGIPFMCLICEGMFCFRRITYEEYHKCETNDGKIKKEVSRLRKIEILDKINDKNYNIQKPEFVIHPLNNQKTSLKEMDEYIKLGKEITGVIFKEDGTTILLYEKIEEEESE